MSKARSNDSRSKLAPSLPMVQLDEEAKRLLADVGRDQTVALSPEEQLVFWQALQAQAKPTPAQKCLGALMRGETASKVPPGTKS